MILLSSFFRNLPPTRVLLGAGIGLASYFLSSVWKSEIDDQIKSYSAILDRATFIETQMASLPMFKASSHFWSESIATQKLQIVTLSQLARTLETNAAKSGDKKSSDRLPLSIVNPQESRAVYRHELIITEFFNKRLSDDVRSMASNLNDYSAVNIEFLKRKIGSCIDFVSFDDFMANQSTGFKNALATTKYSDDFKQIYDQKVAGNAANLVVTPAKVDQIAKNLIVMLEIGRSATQAIEHKRRPSANPLDPYFDELNTLYLEHQHGATRCIEDGKDLVLDDFVTLLGNLRNDVTQMFVKPRRVLKHQIEIAEIFLYVISGVIALYGQMPPGGRGDEKPIGPRVAKRTGESPAGEVSVGPTPDRIMRGPPNFSANQNYIGWAPR